MLYLVFYYITAITQFSDQFRSNLISQLIKGISRVLPELLQYFNGTIVPTLFVPLLPVLPVNFTLRINL